MIFNEQDILEELNLLNLYKDLNADKIDSKSGNSKNKELYCAKLKNKKLILIYDFEKSDVDTKNFMHSVNNYLQSIDEIESFKADLFSLKTQMKDSIKILLSDHIEKQSSFILMPSIASIFKDVKLKKDLWNVIKLNLH
jgi:hypothetical protein